MREASVAANILEAAERQAQGRKITRICVKLGEYTGVIPAALDRAFQSLRAQTRLAREAELAIDIVPLSGHCPDCDWIGQPDRTYCLVCPRCECPVNVLTGRELEVETIDLKENIAACALKNTL
jgi:hydrogenase nickel incorporation protein HypA/HybF